MTSYPTILGNAGGGATAATTTYANAGLGCSPVFQYSFTNELSARQKIHVAGSVSNLNLGVTNALSQDLTYSFRKNATSVLGVTFTAGDTGWKSNSGSVSVSAGDWVDFECDVGAGDSNWPGTLYCATASFTASADSAQILATVGPCPNGPGDTWYGSFLGNLQFDAVEGLSQYLALTAGTWKYLACHIASNTLNASTTINSRLASSQGTTPSDGYLTITIPAGASVSGNFEDITHTDSVMAFHFLGYKFSNAATSGLMWLDWVGNHYVAGTPSNCVIGGTPLGVSHISYGGTKYTSLFGNGAFFSNIQGNTGTLPYDATLQYYSNYIFAGEGTCTLLINGVSIGIPLAISASGTTGWLTDTSHTVAVSAGDTCVNQIVADGTPGTGISYLGAALLVIAS